jgi:hypothetical protein
VASNDPIELGSMVKQIEKLDDEPIKPSVDPRELARG